MNRLRSILVIAERSAEVQSALQKACVVARHFNARIELFACDAEHAWMARHAYDRRGVGEALEACMQDSRRFLEAIRSSISADDLDITTSVACESPLYEGIVRKVLDSQPDLVIKCVGTPDSSRYSALGSTDWQLIRTCPAPLMLTRGRTWQPRPRVAASIDISDTESPAVSRRVLASASYIAQGCGGELEVVYSDSGGSVHSARTLLRQFTDDLGVKFARIEVLEGRPERTLAGFAAQRGVDVMVLGALGHGVARRGVVGTLTETLIEKLDCDFLLVRPDGEPLGSQIVRPGNGAARVDASAA
ncbi:MAG: universal stress protein [Steroidobacteraceae bacterium]